MSTIVLRCVVRRVAADGCGRSEPTGAAAATANPYTVRAADALTDDAITRRTTHEETTRWSASDQRRRQLAREKFLRQQQRRARGTAQGRTRAMW